MIPNCFTRRTALILLSSTAALPLAAQDRPVVAADNYPLAYFAERLGSGNVEVLFLVPAKTDPSLWRPGISDIAAIQGADVIALNGADFSTCRPRHRCLGHERSTPRPGLPIG